jgi:hypothetical protein
MLRLMPVRLSLWLAAIGVLAVPPQPVFAVDQSLAIINALRAVRNLAPVDGALLRATTSPTW